MEDVREYLPLYIGQNVQVKTESAVFTGQFVGYYIDQWHMKKEELSIQVLINKISLSFFTYKSDQCKLIVRRLDSMTEDEIKKIDLTDRGLMLANFEMGNELNFTAKQFVWLLSKGFWIFDPSAFDKGLIIDSKTLNKEV